MFNCEIYRFMLHSFSRYYYIASCVRVLDCIRISAGAEHNVTFCSCQCEPTAVTLVRARLTPASPRLPKLAFTFDLLDWAEALLLECQVALSDFCKAPKSPHLVNKVWHSVKVLCWICS